MTYTRFPVDTIFHNTLGENYIDTRALADFVSVCLHRCQQVFWRRYQGNGCCDFIELGLSLYLLFLSLSMDNITPINQFVAPTGAQLEPPKSSKHILTSGYELHPSLINLVQEQSFSGEGDKNPYTHLQEFEQTCACLYVAGMSHETLKWKLFPFSLMGRAKHCYTRTVWSVQGD